MPTIDQITAYLTAGIAALVTISVPLGLLGSAIELLGARFGLPKIEMLGDKIEKFFFDLPGLLTRGSGARAPKVPPLAVMLLAALVLALPSCSSWKPVARTTNDVARVLCGEFFGQKQGIDVEQAAKKFCETRDDLAPWLDAILAAKREAAPKAAARRRME